MITLESVTKLYDTRRGPKTVLDNINLSIEKSEKIGILGRNGAGKSTMIRIISGAERPTQGKVHRSMSVSWPLAFGGAFQTGLTGVDNIRFICRVYGVSTKDKIEVVDNFAELGAYLYEPLQNYSSGMLSRLAFGISMAVDFDCFLIDEVVAVGDARFQEKSRTELFEKRRHKAMIIVSHDPGFIREHCSRVYVLENGKISSFVDVDEAYHFYHRILLLE
ncbi:ABC transporter ATP-binding protein [Sphingobium mellinum]|uniref:ABC transporter ATP-binding protein n=1 Tax=Sphingobium mellinum TaxID=1387166 RepID=UPI0030ED4B5E